MAENIRNIYKYMQSAKSAEQASHTLIPPHHYQYVWDIVAENNSNIYTSAIEKISRANITNPGSSHHYLYVFGIMLLKISAIDVNISNQENRQRGKSAEQAAQTPLLLTT